MTVTTELSPLVKCILPNDNGEVSSVVEKRNTDVYSKVMKELERA